MKRKVIKSMVDERKDRIINAAIEIIGQVGYEKAKISTISDKAEVASGSIYSPNFFENKLDLLLTIILQFWQNMNEKIKQRVKKSHEPEQKLHEVLSVLDEILIGDHQAIYQFKVVFEALPYLYNIDERNKLFEKRKEITKENRKLIGFLDEIIEEGQSQGKFDNNLEAPVIRQVLFGAFGLLIYGKYLKESGREKEIGYDSSEIRKAMRLLISKFLFSQEILPHGVMMSKYLDTQGSKMPSLF